MTFEGIPADGLAFLSELEANNNKAWFEANRDRYEQVLLGPTQAFLAAMGDRLQAIAPGIQYDTRTDGRGTLMRIHRDTRFRKDGSVKCFVYSAPL